MRGGEKVRECGKVPIIEILSHLFSLNALLSMVWLLSNEGDKN